jgi:hypothetical protein
LSWDVAKSKLTEDENRAGVVKCIAALSLNDDVDFHDGPTVAGISAYRTVYSFFHNRLYKIESELPEGSYRELREAFVAKYGKALVGIAQYQNSFGAKAIGQQLGWKNAVSQISIGQLDAKQRSDPFRDQIEEMDEHIRSTKVDLEALDLSPDAQLAARAYNKSVETIKQINKALEGHNNVLLTIWHNALWKEVESAGRPAVKDRAKDL